MTDEEKRTVLQAIVENVVVAKGKGGGPFDVRRVRINFRTEAFARAARGLGYTGMAGWAERYVPTDRDIAEHEAIQHEAWLETMRGFEGREEGSFSQ